MAETVGALIISAATAATVAEATAAGVTIAGVTISATTVGTTAILAASIGLNYALSALAGAPKQPKPADGLLSFRQPNPVRQGGYGTHRVAPSYMLYETDGGGLSIDVLALSSGRICGVRRPFLHDDDATFTGSFGGVIGAMSDGRYFGNLVTMLWTYGLPVGTAISGVVSDLPAIWTADHRGDGIASLALFATQATAAGGHTAVDNQTKIYPNGKPEPSLVCDLYPVWDIRDATQDPDDPDTWVAYPLYSAATTYAAGDRVIFPSRAISPFYSAGTTYARYAVVSSGNVDWYSRIAGNLGNTPGADLTKWLPIGAPYYSRVNGNLGKTPDVNPDKWCAVLSNPILQAIEYLTDSDHGMGLDREIIITPVIDVLKAKANLCDALVLDKDGNHGPLYTSNGKFNFDDDPADVVGQILATCDGWMTEDGDGSLVIEVGVYSAPTITLLPQHIVGFSINYGTADEQVVNELALTFTDPDNKYKEVAGQSWRDEDDISARGRVRSQSLALTWVQRHSQARRLAKRAMARLSAGHGTITTTLYGLRALGQRWVNVAYPFLPETGTEDAPAVFELSKGTIDFMAGTVTFDWVLVDPTTIDAWIPAIEEGDGPSETIGSSSDLLIDDAGDFLLDDAGTVIINEMA